ncbi:hypothetical protein JKP88DRAFT_224882 [Tribonema minus]|uniref:Uncharacterized protein n=1 Tax=Tribonema minus TaxID=303371 RepID=A0A836CAS1_9STRA|nr:hypothetical protein JKP88DRAFT_224882 [Tribonema minus]
MKAALMVVIAAAGSCTAFVPAIGPIRTTGSRMARRAIGGAKIDAQAWETNQDLAALWKIASIKSAVATARLTQEAMISEVLSGQSTWRDDRGAARGEEGAAEDFARTWHKAQHQHQQQHQEDSDDVYIYI